MAWQSGNRWYPDRYTVGHRKLLLSPEKTPMENLWWLISICCGIWLAKYRVYAYSREAIEELEQELQLRTFLRFRDHVWRGTYRKDLSLYLNVRSAAWGVCSNTIKLWHDKNVLEPSLTIDIDQPIASPSNRPGSNTLTLGDTFATHEVTKLRTRYDMINDAQYKRGVGTKMLDDVTRGTVGYKSVWYAVTESEWDYYLQSCEEFNIQPISKEEFLEKNFPPSKRTDRERQFAKAKWQSDYRNKKKEQGG